MTADDELELADALRGLRPQDVDALRRVIRLLCEQEIRAMVTELGHALNREFSQRLAEAAAALPPNPLTVQ